MRSARSCAERSAAGSVKTRKWEPIHEALGGTNRKPVLDPIPDDWPEDWRSAAEAFRESGRVDRAWTNEKDFPSNFDRVFAIMELGHGVRWREVPDFLNPLLMRRRNELPKFIGALAALADDRRERSSWPSTPRARNRRVPARARGGAMRAAA